MSNVFVFRRPPHGVITEYFGGGKGGSSTTTNNVTQIPPEVLARYNAVNARAEAVAQQPYQAYSNDPNAFVAPLNATQQAGIQNTNIMAGAAQPYYQSATNQLMQAQAGAQPGINAAYQNVGQAQQQGQNYLGAATQNVGQAQQQGQNYLGAATAAGLAGAQAVDPSQLNINQYMNPFTQSVVNATQAAMNQQQGQQLAQQQAEAIRSGAFGGERAGLQRGQLRGQQSLAQAQAIAPLYQQNYNQALAAAQQQQGVGLGAGQANRAAIQNYAQQLGNLGQQGYQQGMGAAQQYGTLGQQGYQQGIGTAQQQAALAQQGYGMGANTSTLLGSIGTNAQQAGLAGAQAQMQAGQAQQQTQQAGLQAMYNQFQQQQGFPYQQAQFLANIATGTGALSGNASSGASTTTGGGGFFSDERLKENIKKVGETNDGQPIYRYNYKGDGRTQIGLLAQDVEKDHPEAVGLAGGYKTVDYKKATEDAVHKAEGGAATDAYAINPSAGNSQMLQENSGKGLGVMPSLPQMITGPQRIEAGANAAQLAAMRAPLVTGTTEPARAGAREELASLLSAQNQPPGPNGDLLGSGPQYRQSRINTLQDWLDKNASPGPQYSSAGGLVGPEGGAFAHGGSFARGGLAEGDYMNPALAYYSPQQAQGGLYGAQLQPMPQRQMTQGTPMQAPQQRQQPDAATSALNMAKLVQTGNEAYKARPDFLRSAEDVAKRKQAEAYKDAYQKEYLKKHGSEPETEKADSGGGDDLLEGGDDFARGGYAGRGYVNPYGGLGGNDILGPIIEEQDTSRRLSNDKVTPPPQPKQEPSGLGQLVDTGLKAKGIYDLGNKAYKGGEWAAGKLGLGGDTAMSATSASAVPGVAGGVVPEAVTAAVPEALTAAVPEALTAAAPEVLTAAIPEAAASIAEFLPFLLLKNGGAVPHRKNYQDGSLVVPDEYSTAEPGLAGAEGGNEDATTGGGETVVRGAPLARPTSNAPTPANAIAAVPVPREPKPAPGLNPSKSFFPEITSEGVRDTLSSENFWVPALAGIGSMLASPNKTLAGAIGSGLVGGTTAYTNLEKQTADQLAKRVEMAKNIFSGPYKDESTGKRYWRMAGRSTPVYEDEYPDLYNKFVNGNIAGVPSGAKSISTVTTDLAKTVTPERVPTPAATAGQQTPAPAPITTSQKPAEGTPPAASGAAPPANVQAAPAPGQAAPLTPKVEAVAARDPNELKDQILSDASRWKDKPLFRNAPMLLQKAQEETEKATSLTTRAAQAGSEDTVNAKANEAALLAEAKRASDNAKTYHDASQKLVDDAASPTIARLNANEADNVKYFNDQAAIDQARQMARMQVNAIRDIVENFESGTFAEQKAHLAGVLRSLGVPPDRIKSATFDADAFQSFTKDMMKNVFADVAKIGGQLKVAELAGLEKASANPSLQPETNQKILAQALGVLNAEDKRYRDEQEARKKLGWNYDRSAFQDEWHGKHKDIGKFVEEIGKDIAVRGATPPDWGKLKSGQAYIVEPDPAHGIMTPTKLRYLGKDPQTGKHKWQKIGGG